MTATVRVRCAGCGDYYAISARVEYEHRRRGLPHRCARCRGIGAGPSPAMVARMKTWWIQTYGLSEIRSWPRF